MPFVSQRPRLPGGQSSHSQPGVYIFPICQRRKNEKTGLSPAVRAPAGRLCRTAPSPHPELHPDSTLSMWPDNRIARDAHYLYRYDRHGRLTEKTDLIPEGVIRTDDERTHRYHYDSQHRLVHYTRTQYEEPLVESRYLYDPLGRRVAKRVWRRERDLTGWMSLSRKPQVTWYCHCWISCVSSTGSDRYAANCILPRQRITTVSNSDIIRINAVPVRSAMTG